MQSQLDCGLIIIARGSQPLLSFSGQLEERGGNRDRFVIWRNWRRLAEKMGTLAREGHVPGSLVSREGNSLLTVATQVCHSSDIDV